MDCKCFIVKPVYCSLNEDLILGKSKCNDKLIKQTIGLDYLAIYFYELEQLINEEIDETNK